MGKLIYSAITSLDGFIEDASGSFDWAMPDEEVHRFVNDFERGNSTYLYGRRMYEVMTFWETVDAEGSEDEVFSDYAGVWQAANKIVYSSTLDSVTTKQTQLRQTFDAEEVRQLKQASANDISIGGPGLAAAAFAAGLVDEIAILTNPVSVGTGKAALPTDLRLNLRLLDERRFNSGVVYLHYAVLS